MVTYVQTLATPQLGSQLTFDALAGKASASSCAVKIHVREEFPPESCGKTRGTIGQIAITRAVNRG